ncbi:MAG: Mur ligase family protein [Pirellulaceae bacterium]|nr:Mur ligase family protein [Pirellulaceae bacterium]
MASSPRVAQLVSLKSLFPQAVFTAGCDIQVSTCSRTPHSKQPKSANHLFVAGVDSLENDDESAASAIARGASAILSERLLPISAPQCLVGDVRLAYAKLLHALLDNPSQKMLTIGVMGTHGKSSVSLMVASMLKKIGGNVAYWTTLGANPELTNGAIGNSDPSAKSLTNWMAKAAKTKMPAVVIELSNEMLVDRTASGIEFDVLVIPSFRKSQKHDRLESRGVETGLLRTIEQLKEHGLVVFNADDARLNRLIDRHQIPAIGYGLDADAQVRGKSISRERGMQTMMISAGNSLMPLSTPLIGNHHLRHQLAAVAVGYAFGLELFEVISGVERLKTLPGRMQSLTCGQDFSVYVDAADQADRLAVALHAMAPLGGRITCVAEVPECADADQRAAYGRVLSRAASRVILTQSRTSTKQGQRMMWEVLDGCDHPAAVNLVPDRSAAIELAIRSAEPGDQILLAGWGNDRWTNACHKQTCSDKEQAEICLHALNKHREEAPAFAQSLLHPNKMHD